MPIRAAQYVDGYCIGNEGLGNRYGIEELKKGISRIKVTDKPATTTEQIEDYFADPALLEIGDFVLPNAHPYWHGITDPSKASQWTAEQFQQIKELLRKRSLDKPILFKEVGLPSAGCSSCSEANQAEYYRLLISAKAKGEIFFSFFEAFDQPWKRLAPVEPHWGLFRSDRSAKRVVKTLKSSVEISINGDQFSVGDRIEVKIFLSLFGLPVDEYIAIVFPDTTFYCLTKDNKAERPNEIVTRVSSLTLPISLESILSYTFTGVEPVGEYTWVAALLTSGSNISSTESLLSFDVETFKVE